MGDVHRLATWLRAHHPSDVLIPCLPTTKAPMKSHKDGKWNWEAFEKFLHERPDHPTWGLLLKELCVIDSDDPAWSLAKELTEPALQTCPKVATKHGHHFFFLRPDFADAEGYFDGARQHGGVDVDFKSVCSTGTSGVIIVAPSPGKSWLPGRELWTTPAVHLWSVEIRKVTESSGAT
jgi:hypothetical protein